MFDTKIRALIVAVAAVAVVGCAAPEPEMQEDTTAEDLAAIDALRDAWVTAHNAADAAALAALYTADAVEAPAGMPSVVGTAAIQQHFAERFAAGSASATVTAEETQVAGDWAFDRGTYSVTMTPAEGEAMQMEGRYIVILQRTPDGWKVARGIDNSPTPPAAPTGEMGGL